MSDPIEPVEPSAPVPDQPEDDDAIFNAAADRAENERRAELEGKETPAAPVKPSVPTEPEPTPAPAAQAVEPPKPVEEPAPAVATPPPAPVPAPQAPAADTPAPAPEEPAAPQTFDTLEAFIDANKDIEFDDPVSGEPGAKIKLGDIPKTYPGLLQIVDKLAERREINLRAQLRSIQPVLEVVQRQEEQRASDAWLSHAEAPVDKGGLGYSDIRSIINNPGWKPLLDKTPWMRAVIESGDEAGIGQVLNAARAVLGIKPSAPAPAAPAAPAPTRTPVKPNVDLHRTTIRGPTTESRTPADPDRPLTEDEEDALFMQEAAKRESERKRKPE